MKLTEIHDDEPLVLHILRKLLKDQNALIMADFYFADGTGDEPEHIDGALYAIYPKMPGVYEFALTNSAAMPNMLTFTNRMVDKLNLSKGRVDAAGHQRWELSYRENA
jgi:hypothetical protein